MAERLNVFPSRMYVVPFALAPSSRLIKLSWDCRVLTALKERMVAAKTGHSLLKRKSDAIKANLNSILREILEVSILLQIDHIYPSSLSPLFRSIS